MVKHTDDLVAESTAPSELDPIFKNQIDRLHGLTVYGRWLAIALLWLTVGAYSLWELRYPISNPYLPSVCVCA
jgi:hypothetical protein